MDKLMKSFLVTILLVSAMTVEFLKAAPTNSCDCVCGVRGRSNRIVGGTEATPHDYPWLAGLVREDKVYCGATLITNRHLVTAAHCINNFDVSEIRVYLGGHNITTDYTEMRRLKKMDAHENFNMISFDNDIAVLEMTKPVKFGSSIQPACLPDGSKRDFTGSLALIAGWGRIAENKPTTSSLHYAIVPVWSQIQCLESGYSENRITENMFCSGYFDGRKDACQGDSGGPLTREGRTGSMELIGVVSWGRGCARPNLPGIYTKVINYLPWIKEQVGKSCMCPPKVGKRANILEKMLDNEA